MKPKKKHRSSKIDPVRRIVKYKVPKQENGNQDKEAVKQIYMSSEFVEWTPFAESLGWDIERTRTEFPFMEWVKEKKKKISLQQAEHVTDLLFTHKGRWQRDVLKTLKRYPNIHDRVATLIEYRINEYTELMNKDIIEKNKEIEYRKNNVEYHPPENKNFNVDDKSLIGLAMAVKMLSESKYHSLLMHDWDVKISEEFTNEAKENAEENKEKWVVEVFGGHQRTGNEIQEIYQRYLGHYKEQEKIAPQIEDEDDAED